MRVPDETMVDPTNQEVSFLLISMFLVIIIKFLNIINYTLKIYILK